MPLYTGIGPDGAEYEIEGPENATQDQINQAIAYYIDPAEDITKPTELTAGQQAYIDSIKVEPEEEEESGFVEDILTGLTSGAVGLFETAALGAATLLEEDNETAAREVIKKAADAITPEGGDKEAITYRLAQGVGSILGFFPTVLLGPAALPAAGALAIGAGSGEASERAREEGATEEERSTAALKGILPGALEIIPLGRIFTKLRAPFAEELVNKFGPEEVTNFASRIKRAGVTGGVEAAQEVASETLQNLIERGYNPSQEIVEGLGEAGTIGGGAGAIVQLLVDSFAGKKVSGKQRELLALPPPQDKLPPPQDKLPPGTGFQPQTLPDGTVANTPEELMEYQRRAQETATPKLPKPPTEEELLARGDFEEIARQRAQKESGRAEARPDPAEARLLATEEELRDLADKGDPQAVRQLQEQRDQLDELVLQQRVKAKAKEANERREARRRGLAFEEKERRRTGDLFPLQSRAATFERPEPEDKSTRPRFIDQQQELAGIETRPEAETRLQREQQMEMFNRQGGIRRPPPLTTPTTVTPKTPRPETQPDLFTRDEPQQGEILGPRGGVRRSRRADFEARPPQRLTATESQDVDKKPKKVTKTDLNKLGVVKTAPVIKRVVGRDLSKPEDMEFVRKQLTDYVNKPENKVTEGTKFKVTKFLENVPDEQMQLFDTRGRVSEGARQARTEDVEPRQLEQETDRTSVPTTVPTPDIRGVQQTEQADTSARGTRASEPRRLDSPDTDTGRPDRAKEGEPAPLTKPKPKTKKTIQKLGSKKSADAKTPEPEKKKEAKTKTPTTSPTPAKTDTTQLDKSGQVATPTPEKPKSETKPKRVPLRLATEGDQKLKEARDSVVKDQSSEWYNTIYDSSKENVATETDKTTIASVLNRVADPQKARKGKQDPLKAVRLYFAKKPRIEDAITLIAHDLLNGGTGKSAYQFTPTSDKLRGKDAPELDIKAFSDITVAEQKAFFSGQGNKEVAKAASEWISGNLSPAVNKLLEERIKAETIEFNKIARRQSGKKFDFVIESRKAEEIIVRKKEVDERAEAASERKAEDSVGTELGKEFGEGVTQTIGDTASSTMQLYMKYGVIADQDLVSDSDRANADISDQITFGRDLLDGLDLPKDAVAASSAPLHPESIAALKEGSIVKALQYLAATTQNTRVRNAAIKLAEVAGTTKISITTKLPENIVGRFVPKTNTIEIRPDAGMNAHTILHEMAHAATSATLAKPSHPMTKQLTQLFEDVKDRLDTAYGATSLDEFVAEVFSNPEFRSKLALMNTKGSELNALQRVMNSIANFLRKLVGMDTKPPASSALTEADLLIDNILAPAPATRNAGMLNMISGLGSKEVQDFTKGLGSSYKKTIDDIKNQTSKSDFLARVYDFLTLKSKSYDLAKQAFFMALPAQSFLVDVLGMGRFAVTGKVAESNPELAGKIKGAELFELFELQEGAMSRSDKRADGMLTILENWAKNNKGLVETFNSVVHNSTIQRVDPSKKESDYSGEQLTAYKALRKDYDSLGKDGQDLYKTLRDFYFEDYKKMQRVVEGRIDSLVDEKGNPAPEEQKVALKNQVFARLFDKQNIEPYFPLTRNGDFWLYYEYNGEPVTRAFTSNVSRDATIADLKNNPDVTGIQTYAERSSISFKNAPPQSFVGQTLRLLEKAEVSESTREEFINMFIDTLPETSFAKSLQKREDKLGFNESATEAFRLKAFDIGRQVVRMEYAQRMRKTMDTISQQIRASEGLRGTDLANLLEEEVVKRGNFAMNPPQDFFARLSRNANRFAFLGTIGFNVSSAVVNLSQVPLIVYPFMVGRTDAKTATTALNQSRKFFAGAGRTHVVDVDGKKVKIKALVPSIDNYYVMDKDGKLSMRDDLKLDKEQMDMAEKMLPLVEASAKRGLLNRSFFYDTLGAETSGKKKSFLDYVSAYSAAPFHTAERFNRQVSLSANYLNELARLENMPNKAKGEDKLSPAERMERAVEYSLYETQQTNGGAVLATAPRIAQGNIGRVAMMYKTFGVQMYYTQFKTALQGLNALKDMGNIDEAQRKMLRRQIIGTQLSVLLISGVQGLTLYGMAVAVANMFLEDDEPDAETMTRQFLGEGLYKGGLNALLEAAGAPVDVAARVGLSNLIIQSNRYNFDPSVEKDIVRTLGGPFYGYASQIGRGIKDLNEGEIQRGVENVLPAAFRNMAKTVRYYDDEGIRTRGYNPIMGELTPSLLAAQFIGFAPAEYTLNMEKNQIIKGIEKDVGTARTKLTRKLYYAIRTGDTEGRADTLKEIQKFNKKNPDYPLTPDGIIRSMRTHLETTATMYNGVTLNPKLRARLLDIAEGYSD